MNLDYITINGLDANTKKRIEEDLAKSGYTGSKSAYVTALMNDGLDKREAIRGRHEREGLPKPLRQGERHRGAA
jgi:hypothetical protein